MTSITNASMCWCAPPSSKPGSTFPPPTPSSSNAPTILASPSCTNCAAALAVRITGAYAWLLTPHPKAMTTDAQKRLEAIASLEDLGAGFALATHDLEIRGAGELLGEDQSGQMETIGFSLYMELLENAVDALKAGREPSLEDLTSQQTEVELRMPSLLPDDFIPDVNTRLSFYKRIASAKNEQDLEEIKVELIDRFGRLPDAVRNLLDIARLRQQKRAKVRDPQAGKQRKRRRDRI